MFMDASNATYSKKMDNFLKENGFGANTIKFSPNWVKIWVNYILWLIENEIWNITEILKDENMEIKLKQEIQDLKI